MEFFRLAETGQAGAPNLRGGHGTEAVVPFAEIEKIARRHGEGAAAFLTAPQDYGEPAGVLVRQRTQQHRIDQAEDGRVGTDAERQHKHRHGCESRRFAQHSKAVKEVPSHAALDAGHCLRLGRLLTED